MFLPFITASQCTVRKCEYCRKGKVIERGIICGEWKCPVCGKTNRAKLLSIFLT